MSDCEMELCPHWSGDGAVCPCAVFDLARPGQHAVNGPALRPPAAASATEHVPEGLGTTGTGVGAVEALARVLDPEAFERPEELRDVGLELYRHDRRKVAVLSATRAVAAGYRLVSEEES